MNVSQSLFVNVVIQFFQYKDINQAVIFNCGKGHTDTNVNQREFFDNDFRMTNMNMDCVDFHKIHASYSKIGMILNTSCSGWIEMFDCMNYNISFTSPFSWLVLTDNLSYTTDILSRYPIEVNSDLTLCYTLSGSVHLYEAFNTGFYTHGSFKARLVSHLTNSLKISKRNRWDLSGVALKCMAVVISKFKDQSFEDFLENSVIVKSDNLHRLKYFTVMKYLREMYNMTYILQRTNSWGYLRNNSSFDGMIGSLQRGDSDIGGSPAFVRIERAKVVDYAVQTWHSRQSFIMRHPKHPDGFYSIYTRPLSQAVWFSIFVLLTLIAIVLCFLLKLNAVKVPGDEQDSSTSLAMLFIWSAVCQQGMSINRNSTAVKVVIFASFIFTLTVYQYYNAMVVSTLLREPPKTIRTLQDLLNSNLKIGIENVVYNKDFFKHTTDTVAIEMFERKVMKDGHGRFYPAVYGMAQVKKGGYAFHVDCATGYAIIKNTFSEREICDTHEVALYPPQSMGAVVRKGSPYKEHVAYGLRKIYEAGLMKRIISVWDEPRPACVHTPDTSIFAVSIREFSMALIALVFGMLASVAILAGEMIVYKFSRKRVLVFLH